MAMAQDLDSRFHFDQTLFRGRHWNATREKEAGQRLHMSAAQAAPRDESLGLPSPHLLILNGIWLEDASREQCYADF